MPDEGSGKLRGIDYRNIPLLKKEGNPADMILMSVGDDPAPDLGFVLDQMGKIRNDIVDSRPCGIRKPDTAVDNQNIILVLDTIKVFSDLTKTAKGIDLDRIGTVFFD